MRRVKWLLFLYLHSVTLTPDQKTHASQLIASGRQLEAVRYLREVLGVSLEQGMALAEKLEAEEGGAVTPLAQRVTTHLKSGSSVAKLVGRIFMTVGLLMIGVAAYFVYSNRQFEQRARPVQGTVVDFQSYVSTNDNSSTTMYKPVFEYVFNGKTYTYVSTTSSSSPEFEVGEKVNILVNPQNPEDVLVDSFLEKWLISLILGIMGTFFTGMGYVAYRVLGRSGAT